MEVRFLSGAHYPSSPFMEKILRCIKGHMHEVILVFLIVLYITYFTTASFLHHNNFYSGRYDLGNMDQTVWNTINGNFFSLSNDKGNSISRLSSHADFILILLAPFYLLWSDPKMLLLIQTIIVALGAFFVYKIAHKSLLGKNLSLCFAFIYLLNPSLQYANLYDFHAVVLATTFLLGAWYFLISAQYRFFYISLFLAAITKEQLWAIVALFGVYIAIVHKKRIEGILLMALGAVLFYFLIWYAIPAARGKQHFAVEFYQELGSSPSGIVSSIILHPLQTLGTMLEKEQTEYLKQLFLPLGYLPLFAPIYLIFALPDFMINTLSNNRLFYQIFYHYTAIITPFIFIAAIYGVQNIMQFLPRRLTWLLIVYLIGSAVYSAYQFGPLAFSKRPNTDMFTKPQPKKDIINQELAKIPQSVSVAATNNLGAHLSHRQILYTIPIGIEKSDYIVFLLNDAFAQPSLDAQKRMAEELKSDNRYEIVFAKDDFLVLKRK